MERIWMWAQKIFIKQLVNFLAPKLVSLQANTNIWGPTTPLDKQLKYDPNTDEVLEWYVQPYNKVDEIAARHDICYDMSKNKGDCERAMVK